MLYSAKSVRQSAVRKSIIGEISEENGKVEPIIGETVSLSVVVEEVETVGEEVMKDLSYPEIAQQEGIFYQNVCKRISLARKQLKQRLSKYFRGSESEVSTAVSVESQLPTPRSN